MATPAFSKNKSFHPVSVSFPFLPMEIKYPSTALMPHSRIHHTSLYQMLPMNKRVIFSQDNIIHIA